MNTVRTRLKVSLIILILLFITGTITFVFAEGHNFFDSLYFSIVTMATVGYGDITPKTVIGKVAALVMIVGGVSTFMGVIANATELYMEKRDEESRSMKLNMISGLFFGEVGDGLLSNFLRLDGNRDELIKGLMMTQGWTDGDFRDARCMAKEHAPAIKAHDEDITVIDGLLDGKKDFLLRLLENPTLVEHGRFTDIIRATFHLREEVFARREKLPLPETDLKHLSIDMERVYKLMLPLWISYMHHLKSQYPYLYSFALRMNPISQKHDPVVRG